MKQVITYNKSKLREQETQNNASDDTLFTQEEKRFLGTFALKGNQHLGVIYSKSVHGLQEFLSRSGKSLNLTPGVFTSLLKYKIIEIVPYGGYSRNEDYTIRLNLNLEDVQPYAEIAKAALSGEESTGAESVDTDTAPSGGGGGGFAPSGGGAEPEAAEEPDMDVEAEPEAAEIPADVGESIMRYNDILMESAKIVKKILIEQRVKKKINYSKSRVIQRLPTGYIFYLEKIFKILGKKIHNDLEREHLVADILDNLSHHFGLTPAQIFKSYAFYRNQNRLQHLLKK